MTGTIALSSAMQDYLEVILDLSEAAAEEGIRVTDIAARLNITKASVTQAIQALKESGLVTHERYGTVRLTRAGRQRALEVRHRHRTLRRFLVEVLGVDARTAEKDACLMEHAVSRQTMEKLVEFLERVGRDGASGVREGAAEDRSGASPPAEDGREKRIMRSVNIKALSELRPGERGRVVRVGAGAQVRRRILDMGVTLGTEIEVKGVAPFGDPIKLLVKGYDLSLRKQEAATVFVEVL